MCDSIRLAEIIFQTDPQLAREVTYWIFMLLLVRTSTRQ